MQDYVEVVVCCPNCEEETFVELKISVEKMSVDHIKIDSEMVETSCGECGHILVIRASGMMSLDIDEYKPVTKTQDQTE